MIASKCAKVKESICLRLKNSYSCNYSGQRNNFEAQYFAVAFHKNRSLLRLNVHIDTLPLNWAEFLYWPAIDYHEDRPTDALWLYTS